MMGRSDARIGLRRDAALAAGDRKNAREAAEESWFLSTYAGTPHSVAICFQAYRIWDVSTALPRHRTTKFSASAATA